MFGNHPSGSYERCIGFFLPSICKLLGHPKWLALAGLDLTSAQRIGELMKDFRMTINIGNPSSNVKSKLCRDYDLLRSAKVSTFHDETGTGGQN